MKFESLVSGTAFGFIQDVRANGIFNIVESPALMKKIILLQEDTKLTIRLKRPRWVVSDEGWDFGTKDRNHVEYTEDGNVFLIEVEYGLNVTYVYFDTIRAIDKNSQLNCIAKEKIKRNIVRALDLMGGRYEIC